MLSKVAEHAASDYCNRKKMPLNLLLGPEYYCSSDKLVELCIVANVKPIFRQLLPPEVY
jgi:hypothetical protein